MTPSQQSRRRILSTTSIMGGAGVFTLLLSLVRTKLFALLLGPGGIGLLGLVNNLLSSGALLAGMGVTTSGVRMVSKAAAVKDLTAIARARTILFVVTGVLALLGAALLWLLRVPAATYLLGDRSRTGLVGWIALGIVLTLAAGSQVAFLNGLHRIGDIAKIQVLSAVFATIVGVAAILKWGEQAVVGFVLAVPLGTFLLGAWYVRRLQIPAITLPSRTIAANGFSLAKLGLSFMIAQLVISGGMLAIRTKLEGSLGLNALGQFEAAWLISSVYLGAVLSAMTTDYYPRLTALEQDAPATVALVNDQTRIALWLCGPVCVAMIAFAPIATHVLFSPKFAQAAEILRWQILGDVLKLLSWPLGFLLLARNDGSRYLVLESVAVFTFVATVWLGLPWLGLVSTGYGYVLMYCVYLPLAYGLARRHCDFSWDSGVKHDAMLLVFSALVAVTLAIQQPMVGGALSLLIAGALAWRNAMRLRAVIGSDGWRSLLHVSAPIEKGPPS